MNKVMKIIVVVGLIIIVGVVIAVKQHSKAKYPEQSSIVNAQTPVTSKTAPIDPQKSPAAEELPKLVDLGADKCIPCKMMAPILDELKQTYAGKLEVVFIDVWKNPDQAKAYNINLIPTQIFYGAAGKELFRHEGFFSKEEILGKWKEFGVVLESETP